MFFNEPLTFTGIKQFVSSKCIYFQKCEPDMEELLQKLRSKVKVALVGGSDLVKVAEQMGGDDGGCN